MTAVGHVVSGLGRIELHVPDEAHETYTTRGYFTDCVDGVTRRECAVPQDDEHAAEWWDLMAERGAVYGRRPR